MANRRLLDSSNQDVVVVAANRKDFRQSSHKIYMSTKTNTKSSFQSKGFLLTVTIVICLLSSDCIGFLRLIQASDNIVYESRWQANSQPQFYYIDSDIIDKPIKSNSLQGWSSDQFLAENPSTYYVASNPEANDNYPRYLVDNKQQQSVFNGDKNYYYPLISNSPSSNSDNDKQLKTILHDLTELEGTLSQLDNYDNDQSSSLSNNNNNYDIQITNPIVYPNLVESTSKADDQQIESKSSIESEKQASISKLNSNIRTTEGEKSFTLLEDQSELLSANKNSGKNVNDNKDNKDDSSKSSKISQDSSTTPRESYGKVVTSEPSSSVSQKSASSMFDNMYKKLSGYLPFLSQINILKNGQQQQQQQAAIAATTTATTKEDDQSKKTQEEKRKFVKEFTKDDDQANTKPSVSRASTSEQEIGGSSIKPANKEVGLSEAKMSLLRKSNLMMPFESTDDVAGEASSLLGKYIYPPEHDLHSTTLSDSPQIDNADQAKTSPVKKLNNEFRSSKLSHRTYSSRRLNRDEDDEEEGLVDDEILDNYERAGYRPYYSHRRIVEPMVNQQNKTNDLYFLIMVGSFCAMAVAVVLAAGLFAYRVQQNRKATIETDYPTYGVVGPNSMAGGIGGAKLGAASFVGGYFNSNLGAGANPSLVAGQQGINSSGLAAQLAGACKLESVKHLSDLYSISDSGILSSNNHSGKSSGSSTRRISCEQQQQQPIVGQQQHQQNNNQQAGVGGNKQPSYAANCQDAARMYHYQHQKQQMIISDRSSGRHNSASDLDSEDENDDGSYTVYECPGLASAHEMEIKNPLFNDDQTP